MQSSKMNGIHETATLMKMDDQNDDGFAYTWGEALEQEVR
jgi:hypothetical protein